MVSHFQVSLAQPLLQGNNSTSEVFVNSVTTAEGHVLVMSTDFPFGVGYIVVEPTTSNFEIIKFTGIDSSGVGFTGCSSNRGLPTYISGGETSVTANIKSHSVGVDVIITDNINWFIDHFTDLHTAQTIAGVKTFSSYPVLPSSDNASGHQPLSYNQGISIMSGSVGTATPTTFGTVKTSTSTTTVVSTDDTRFTTLSGTASSGSNQIVDLDSLATTSTNNAVVRANASGLIDSTFLTNAAPLIVRTSFIANTTITKGQALIVGNGTSGYLTMSQINHGSYSNNNGASETAQSFVTQATTTNIRGFTINASASNVSYPNLTAYLYATSSHLPTGGSLGSVNFGITSNTTGTYSANFSSPITVSPSTEYALVFVGQTGSGATVTYITMGYNAANYGSYVMSQSTNTGGSWTPSANSALYLQVYEVGITSAGKVQPSDTTQTVNASDNDDLTNNFVGFANANASANASVAVNIGGIDSNQTGLTPGVEYYLSGASGALGTSGTVKIGLATTSTSILIKQTNYP